MGGMRASFCRFVLLGVMVAISSRVLAQDGKLKIFFIDVEGGQSTVFVTPAGQSLLIDTGWPEHEGRDADRIVAAAKAAGITRIDYLLLTHYHTDHTGGVPQLVARIPVGMFIDHGANIEPNDPITEKGYELYQGVLASGHYKHMTAHVGDVLPIEGMKATVVSSNGDVLSSPLPGAGEANPYCKDSEVRKPDTSENGRSLGLLIHFGSLKILDLGDLTWDREMTMMCPINRLGRVDILVVSHHGMNMSSSPALVDAVEARVAIMDNGETKGGSVQALETIAKAPGLETLWQLHYSDAGGHHDNTADAYIANLPGPDAGNGIELIAEPAGSFQIVNARTGVVKRYDGSR
jgi:competence protein ComEC